MTTPTAPMAAPATPSDLVSAMDAILDEARLLLNALPDMALPPILRQARDLINGADVVSDALMELMGVNDPDDGMGSDDAQMAQARFVAAHVLRERALRVTAASKNTAPYKILKEGGKWVVKNNAGETKSSFPGDDAGRKKALQYLRALYANVPGAAKQADKKKWTGKQKSPVTVKSAAVTIEAHDFAPSVVYPENCGYCGLSEEMSVHHGEAYTVPVEDDVQAWPIDYNPADLAPSATDVSPNVVKSAADGKTAKTTPDVNGRDVPPHRFVPSEMEPKTCLACGLPIGHAVHSSPGGGQPPVVTDPSVVTTEASAHKKKCKYCSKGATTHVSTAGYFGGGLYACNDHIDDAHSEATEAGAGVTATEPDADDASSGTPVTAQTHGPQHVVLDRIPAMTIEEQIKTVAHWLDRDPDWAKQILVPEIAKKFSAEKRDKMAKSGQAMPGGDYPIDDAESLKAAIKLVGQSNDHSTESVKRHIIKRAKDLGLTNLLPAEWSGSTQKAFLTQIHDKTLITAPAEIFPQLAGESPNKHFLRMVGKFVGGEVPNRNGALWTLDDLEIGSPTVAHGPLNWLHEEHHILGAITDAALMSNQTADDGTAVQPYIAAAAAVWKWLWPTESAVLEMASEQGKLYYSMECVSENVMCAGDNGCGTTVNYGDFLHKIGTCAHMTQGASSGAAQRFMEPTFLGGAAIVPPSRPGWADASASVIREAASFAPRTFAEAGEPDISATDWELMMAQLVRFAS